MSFRQSCGIVLAVVTSIIFFHEVSDLAISGESSCEVRGTWLNAEAFDSAAKRKDILKKIGQANLNTVFLIAPPIQENPGHSTHENFSAMLKGATLQGISVHAWITSWFRLPEGVNFTLPQEQAQQVQWAKELLMKYPAIDGIHFDYIRYMNWENAEYDKMQSVSNVIRLAFRAIKQHNPRKLLTAAVISSTPNYANYKKEYIPGWFSAWKKAHPRNSYSTFGGLIRNYVPEGFKYQQDAIGWLNGSFIDAIIPMEYVMDDTRWQKNVKHWLSFRDGNPNGIYIGLGWLEEKGEPDFGFDAPGIVRKIKYGRQLGFKGFVIFELSAFNHIDQTLINALSVDSGANDFNAPFKTPTRSCISSAGNRLIKSERP